MYVMAFAMAKPPLFFFCAVLKTIILHLQLIKEMIFPLADKKNPETPTP